jgi:hypothetical protein
MADKAISALTEDTSPTANDIVPMVDVETGTTKKTKLSTLAAAIASLFTAGSISGTKLADDTVPGLKLGQAVACKAVRTTDQSIPNSTNTNVLFTAEDYDTDGMHSTTINSDRITIPAGLGGLYEVKAACRFTTNTTNRRFWAIQKNGTTNIEFVQVPAGSGGGGVAQALSLDVQLAAGDYVNLQVFQDSGSTISVEGAVPCFLSVRRVGSV